MCEPITATAVATSAASGAAAAAGTAAAAGAATAGAATAATAATTFGVANTTWAALGQAASLIGTGFSAMSSIEQGKNARATAEYNARMGEIKAQDVINQAAIEQEKQRQKINALRGSQRASAGASGIDVDSGSSGEIGEQTVVLGEEDVQTIRNNAARAAWGYRAQSQLDMSQGRSIQGASRLNAAGTLLSGGAKAMGSKWWKDLS